VVEQQRRLGVTHQLRCFSSQVTVGIITPEIEVASVVSLVGVDIFESPFTCKQLSRYRSNTTFVTLSPSAHRDAVIVLVEEQISMV
jgi:hypothetical protein